MPWINFAEFLSRGSEILKRASFEIIRLLSEQMKGKIAFNDERKERIINYFFFYCVPRSNDVINNCIV